MKDQNGQDQKRRIKTSKHATSSANSKQDQMVVTRQEDGTNNSAESSIRDTASRVTTKGKATKTLGRRYRNGTSRWVNSNWVKERPIEYPLDADGRRVRLK